MDAPIFCQQYWILLQPHLCPDAETSHVPPGGEREKVEAVHARRLHTRKIAESAVETLFFSWHEENVDEIARPAHQENKSLLAELKFRRL